MARALVNIPKAARPGEIVEARVLIAHPMETGFRPGADGKLLPRDVITRFDCSYDGREVFAAELFPAVAANPYLSFTFRATRSGTVTLRWHGDNGFAQTETAELSVTA